MVCGARTITGRAGSLLIARNRLSFGRLAGMVPVSRGAARGGIWPIAATPAASLAPALSVMAWVSVARAIGMASSSLARSTKK